jgi:hypothetical protein
MISEVITFIASLTFLANKWSQAQNSIIRPLATLFFIASIKREHYTYVEYYLRLIFV